MSVIPSWAKVGAKVVCVDALPYLGGVDHFGLPSVGRIYLISWVGRWTWADPIEQTGVGIRVEGVKRLKMDPPFGIYRFRPLVTKSAEDDIAMFLSLLRPADAIELAEAMLETAWENGR